MLRSKKEKKSLNTQGESHNILPLTSYTHFTNYTLTVKIIVILTSLKKKKSLLTLFGFLALIESIIKYNVLHNQLFMFRHEQLHLSEAYDRESGPIKSKTRTCTHFTH